ncbi:MAG TPA: Wzz/FepE/Etk N-terminal domain-containing protein [Pseudomonas sp.]|nr:Wzz/FepE/Etk N-terminal domain-containing protein [Pseudomonas sp.]
MNQSENYLHEFLRIFFANRQLIKRVFLFFAVITLLIPVLAKPTYDISAEVLVQSKKLPQLDPSGGALSRLSDVFVPPTLIDMETESSILRSPALIRRTVEQLYAEGHFQEEPTLLQRWVTDPLRRHVSEPLQLHVFNPLRELLGLEIEPIRDNLFDSLAMSILEDLEIQTLPGSNVISLLYSAGEPVFGTLLVNRLLDTYLVHRQELYSNDLPLDFYEQKKLQYQERLGGLEQQRLALLESARAANPDEEITFLLGAINQEELNLSQYRDRALEGNRWLEYLHKSLSVANEARLSDYSFPYTFAQTLENATYDDREIRQLGDRLIELVSQYGTESDIFQADSVPMQTLRAQIQRAREQFLQVVRNRIQEREKSLEIINGVIAQKTARVDEYKTRIRDLQGIQSQLRQLNTETEALHQAFFAYTQRYEESRSSDVLSSLSNARILTRPFEPTEATFPVPSKVIPLGLLTGLLLAIALGYIREFFDHRFKHPGQIGQQLGLPVLMTIDANDPDQPDSHKTGRLPWIRHWAAS